MALSNTGHEEGLTLAKAACESAGSGAQALLWALLAETAEGGAAVSELTTLLTGCHAETRGEVFEAHPGLGSILVLPTRATRAKSLDATF